MPANRSTAAANFITDLGVRRSEEPGEFLRLHLANMPANELPPSGATGDADVAAAMWDSDELGERALCGLLDACVCFAGDWDEALRLARHVVSSHRPPETYTANHYLGCVLAANGDVRAGEYLARASKLADTESRTFMTLIRTAAWQLKRMREPEDCSATLTDAVSQAERWRHDRRISAGDLAVLTAIAKNLRALVAVSGNDLGAGLALVTEAHALSSHRQLVTVEEDAARRYHAQATVNLIQMLWRCGQPDESVRLAEQHVEWTAANHRPSHSEALHAAGYIRLLRDEPAVALTSLVAAEELILAEGAPLRLRQCRKMIVAALHKLGSDDRAQRTLDRMAADPLGLDGRCFQP